MKEKIKSIIENLSNKYQKVEKKYKDTTYYVFNYYKYEQINKNYCIYYFPELTKEQAKEVFVPDFSPNQNDIISAGVGFIDSNELWICNFNPNEFKKVIKNIDKITGKYFTLLEKAFAIPFDAKNLEPLFDRKDLIEEFYKLYRNTKEFLLEKNKVKGVPEERKGEFADQFLLTILTLWFLQERGFFNRDTNYLKNKFKEVNEKKGNFFEFLQKLFENLAGNTDEPILHSKELGDLVILGPALFLYEEKDIPLATISIENKCFYQEGMTEKAISIEPKRLSDSLPILNLFESRDWAEGNIDEFVLGAVYEKLINTDEKKGTGSFYTPEDITTGMSEKAILDYIKKQFTKKFSEKNEIGLYAIIREANQDELIFLFELVSHLKICDPAVGSAHFLESAIETMVHVYEEIWKRAISLNLKKKFYIQTGNETGEIVKIDITELHPEKEFEKEKFYLYIKYFIILSRNIYGVDISGRALKVAKARLFLTMAKHFNLEKNTFVRFPNVHFNLREGNSLVGYITLAEPPANSKKRDIVSHDLFSFAAKDTNQLQKILEALPKEFKAKIQKLSLALGQKGKILLELEDLGNILANKKLDSADFKRALEIKSDLSQIHIASLSTNFALQLQSILEKINLLFREKLDARFVEEYELGAEGAKSLKRNQTFHWQMEFPEVFYLSPHSADNVKSATSSPSPKRRGDLVAGFDIILGNPPYIQFLKIKDQADIFEKLGYETFTKTGDIYCLFYERQIDLLCSGGYGYFITSNKWMRTEYGRLTRKFFIENTIPLLLIDFSSVKIFDTATVDTNLLFLEKPYLIPGKKVNTSRSINCVRVESDFNMGNRFNECIEKKSYVIENLSDDAWVIGDVLLVSIKQKVESQGLQLKDWNVNIYRGIITGYDECFVISKELKEQLVKKNSKNINILKPILRGRDIKKWNPIYNDLWLINTHNGIKEKNIPPINVKEDYPEIFEYLNSKEFKPVIENRADKGNHWTNLRNCAFLEEFEKPKIIYPNMTKFLPFIYDETGYYVNAKCYMLVGESLKYLVAIFNSIIFKFCFSDYFPMLGEDRRELQKIHFVKIPIKRPTPELQKPFEAIVDYIITGKKLSQEMKNPSLNTFAEFFERVIDGMVFELYFDDEFKAKGIKILEHLKDLPSILDQKDDLGKATFLEEQFQAFTKPKNPVNISLATIDLVESVRYVLEDLRKK